MNRSCASSILAGACFLVVPNVWAQPHSPAALRLVEAVITDQPRAQTVVAGASATFSVVVTNAAHVDYRWSFNGIPVGANSQVYTRNDCRLSEDGGEVQVAVCDGRGAVLSRIAMLKVNPSGPSYYAAVNGSDKNTGLSADSPWSLNYALKKLGPGVTVTMLPGTYTGPVKIYYVRGSAQAPATLRSQGKWQAVIAGSQGYGVEIFESEHVVLDGICISNSVSSGIKILSGNNTIRHCWVTRNGNQTDQNGIESNSVNATNNVIEQNLVELNAALVHSGVPQGHGLYVSGPNHTVRGNVLRSNGGFGLHFYTRSTTTLQHNARVYNNLTYGHRYAYGMTIYGATEYGALPGTNYLFNNTILDGLNVEHGTILVRNNIILPGTMAPTMPIRTFRVGSLPVVDSDYNVSTCPIAPRGVHDTISKSVGFVDETNGLYWLMEDSAARGRACQFPARACDFYGNAQAFVTDAGAFQYTPGLAADTRSFTTSSTQPPDYWWVPR